MRDVRETPGEVTTSSTLAIVSARAPSNGATIMGAPSLRAVDVFRRLSSSRTIRAVKPEDANAAGSNTASDGLPGSDASLVSETASVLGGAGCVDGPVVARRSRVRARSCRRSTRRRDGGRRAPRHPLDEARDVVPAVDVRPLVHDNLIELLVVQCGEGDRCDGDRRGRGPSTAAARTSSDTLNRGATTSSA